MFFRLLMESFRRQRRRKMLAGVAILLGTTAVTAMLALATTIGDRIHKELAVYGANIVVYPKADLLDVKVGGVDVKPASGGAYLEGERPSKAEGDFLGEQYYGGEPGAAGHNWRWRGRREIRCSLLRQWGTGSIMTSARLKTGAPALHPWWRLEGWPGRRSGRRYVVVGSEFCEAAWS